MFRDRYTVTVTGSLQSVYASARVMHCRYSLVVGPEWSLLAGLETAATQTCKSAVSDYGRVFSFGAPLQATFLKGSRGPLGWPSFVLECYAPGGGGRDLALGYGVARVPMESGRHHIHVPLFQPQAQRGQRYVGKIGGITPEYTNPRALGKCVSRSHTSTRSAGAYAELDVFVTIG